MKVYKITAHNFKGFDERTFELSDPFTLIIGDNGKGKTAILDALAIGLSDLLSGFHEEGSFRNITNDDVRQQKYQQGETPDIQPQYPASVTWEGVFEGQDIVWTQSVTGRNRPPKDKNIENLSKQLREKADNGENIRLPLVAYYGTDRLWIPNPKKSDSPGVSASRIQGYLNCLHPDANVKKLIQWLKQETEKSLKSGQESDLFLVVKNAIYDCMKEEDWNDISYVFGEAGQGDVLAKAKDGRLLPLRMLSDGVRNVLAMVADIAYRAAMLNPHFGRDAAKKTSGIVLIDEIDLHLHPSWQRHIVEDLHRTFPEIQFIATTHSPFIVQSLRKGKLLNLEDPQETSEYYDQSIEDITENVMGVELPQKSERFLKMKAAAKEYYAVLEESQDASPERKEQLKIKLDELEMPYSDNPAYHAYLEIKREAVGMSEEQE
ncbi:AAA family ATPase [Laspinema sp. D1]|uniref:AAA family ATPase n=1 Tax=Laspinema palackyanum D2a TaxID=2953684 RepID=A0ABT2MU99_9CYAN|nr:AAA family ATPase [Laspinema sp. D2a]